MAKAYVRVLVALEPSTYQQVLDAANAAGQKIVPFIRQVVVEHVTQKAEAKPKS